MQAATLLADAASAANCGMFAPTNRPSRLGTLYSLRQTNKSFESRFPNSTTTATQRTCSLQRTGRFLLYGENDTNQNGAPDSSDAMCRRTNKQPLLDWLRLQLPTHSCPLECFQAQRSTHFTTNRTSEALLCSTEKKVFCTERVLQRSVIHQNNRLPNYSIRSSSRETTKFFNATRGDLPPFSCVP